jgi:archaellum component FlaG (FlaF/FlaG flagellin family)
MNIKIGKGGSGKVNSTKGGSGKTNEKKYIDLLPPNFISKVTLSGGTYSNGVYTRNSGGTTTFNGPGGKYIGVFVSTQQAGGYVYYAYDSTFPDNPTPVYSSFDSVTWFAENAGDAPAGTVPTAVTQNALTFLFDPIFYKKEIQNERYKILVSGCSLSYVNGIYSQTVNPKLFNNRPHFLKDDDTDMAIYDDGAGSWVIRDSNQRDYTDIFIKINNCNTSECRPDEVNWNSPDGGDALGNETPPTITQYLNETIGGGALDPCDLEQIREYQINGVVPTVRNTASSIQHIYGVSFNTKKAQIINNTFSYIKNPDNSDVENKRGTKNYKTSLQDDVAKHKDSYFPLLYLKKNDISPLYTYGPSISSTLNLFIRLQRPIQHKNKLNPQYISREKKGVFFNSNIGGQTGFTIGYRSPHYNIVGQPSYRGVFNNFSFIFSMGYAGGAYITNSPTSKYINFTLMTDYKYSFGKMHMLTLRCDGTDIQVYINGELQTTALLQFNPLTHPSPKPGMGGFGKNMYSQRKQKMPLGPGFRKLDGTVYANTGTSWGNGYIPYFNGNYFCLGKSNIGNTIQGNSRVRKRHLNNLDIGVINTYNVALSQTQISELYNNFIHRYK